MSSTLCLMGDTEVFREMEGEILAGCTQCSGLSEENVCITISRVDPNSICDVETTTIYCLSSVQDSCRRAKFVMSHFCTRLILKSWALNIHTSSYDGTDSIVLTDDNDELHDNCCYSQSILYIMPPLFALSITSSRFLHCIIIYTCCIATIIIRGSLRHNKFFPGSTRYW